MIKTDIFGSSIRSRIFQLAILTCSTLFVLELILVWSIRQAQSSNRKVEHTVDSISALRVYSRDLIDAELDERSYLLTQQASYLAPYQQALAAEPDLLARLRAADPSDPTRQKLAELAAIYETELQNITKSVQLCQAGRRDEALALMNTGVDQENIKKFRQTNQDIFNIGTNLLKLQQANADADSTTVLRIVGIGGFLVILIIVISAKKSADAITRRFHNLMHGIAAISNGNLEMRVDVQSSDEFGILANEFNKMTDHLVESNLARDHSNALVASAKDSIGSTDLEARVTSWNPAAEGIFGFTKDEMMKQSASILLPDSQIEEAAEIIARVKAGESVELETIRRRKNGDIFHVSMTSSPIRAASGDIIGISKIVRDITERKTAETLREKLIAQLTASNTELSHFAYAASHDMQEPLRMISSFAQIIVADYADILDQEGKIYLDIISNAAVRMKTMINDLLKYASLSEEKPPFKPVNIADILDNIRQNLAQMIIETGARISDDALPVIRCNETQIFCLFQNLLTNALKYKTPDITPIIHITATEREGDFLFAVRDNGIGIPDTFREEIFRPFRRLQTWDDVSGTGLGLAICKRIAETHAGTLWVEPAAGVGSVFCFTVSKELA
jgi:PAS domain S-box-containing protein